MKASRHSVGAGALVLIGLLCAACDLCDDCDRLYIEAWILVEATTVGGTGVANVTIRADAVRPMQTWMDRTDTSGRALLQVFTTSFPDSVQVSAEPPADFTTPQPVTIAPLVARDTADVVFTLQPVSPVMGGV
jgi:hypothetical protein